MRTRYGVLVLMFVASCGGSPSSPTQIPPAHFSSASSGDVVVVDRTGPQPVNGLPPVVPAMTGLWFGLLSVTIDGEDTQRTPIDASIVQDGRALQVSWRSSATGTITGTVIGSIARLGGEATLSGRVTMESRNPVQSGRRCNDAAVIDGQTLPLSVYWTGSQIVSDPTCPGKITHFRITLAR